MAFFRQQFPDRIFAFALSKEQYLSFQFINYLNKVRPPNDDILLGIIFFRTLVFTSKYPSNCNCSLPSPQFEIINKKLAMFTES